MTAILTLWIRKHVFMNMIMFHTHKFMKINEITSTWIYSMSGCLFLCTKDNITDSSITQIHAKYLSNNDLSTFSFLLLRWRNILASNSQIFFWKGHLIKPPKNPLPDIWDMNKPVHDREKQSMEVKGVRTGPSEDYRWIKLQIRN